MTMTPLAGLRVLDFSRVLAAPLATQIMAAMGAEVIKIERPDGGDESRTWEPKFPNGESGYFLALNRGKKSVTLNLKTAEGRRVARDLARKADIVIENFLTGEMEKFGLGYDKLSSDNPGLIYVSNTGFGRSGPYSDRRGYDTVFQALAGVMHLTGYPDAPPAKVGLPFSDLTSGLWIAIATLGALQGRTSTGKGSHIDLAMMDVQVSLLTIAAARLFALGEDPMRVGTQHLGRVPSAAFECADGRWLHITVSDQHWLPMCAALDLPDLAADEALATNEGRIAGRDRIMAAMRGKIAQIARPDLATMLRKARVPAGEVNTVAEILSDPHTLARGMVKSFAHPVEGEVPALSIPYREAGAEYPDPPAPPLLGADTDAVLREVLGYDDARLAALKAEGAV